MNISGQDGGGEVSEEQEDSDTGRCRRHKCDRCNDEVAPWRDSDSSRAQDAPHLCCRLLLLLLQHPSHPPVCLLKDNHRSLPTVKYHTPKNTLNVFVVYLDQHFVDDNDDDDDKEDNERADVFIDTLHTLGEKVSDRQTVVNDGRSADG